MTINASTLQEQPKLIGPLGGQDTHTMLRSDCKTPEWTELKQKPMSWLL